MDISSKVRMALAATGKLQNELMFPLGMKSKQTLSNKFAGNRWSAEDLVNVAGALGCDIAFILPNGEKISLKG